MPTPLAAPLTLSKDAASWTLSRGSLRLMQPLDGGEVTGFIFEGEGTFRLEIADRFEIAQLHRFSKKPATSTFTQTFTQLVVRATPRFLDPLGAPTTDGYEKNDLAAKRREHWLKELEQDIDARIVLALLSADDEFVRADIKTNDYGWLTFDYDARDAEELTLSKFDSPRNEIWLSLDRAADRGPDGRPSSIRRADADIEHVDTVVDLTRFGKTYFAGLGDIRPLNGIFDTTVTFANRGTDGSAFEFDLHREAILESVSDESGGRLPFIRSAVGGRALEKRTWDNSIVVIFPKPLSAGEKRRLRFHYSLDLPNYAFGDTWYPTAAHAGLDTYTARMTLTVDKRNEARAMGRLEGKQEGEKTETTVWNVTKPVKMISFVTNARFQELRLRGTGIPEIISFAPIAVNNNAERVKQVATDVADAVTYFQWLFDAPLDTPALLVTGIGAWHGQSFDGMLELGNFTYEEDHPGPSDLFRAHEVAHQWWGHMIGWESYRDQWLSEAFAEYSAMMFVEKEYGTDHLNEILMANTNILLGSIKGSMSKYSRRWLIEVAGKFRESVGPISVGGRASTAEYPQGYRVQTYTRGPLVLHMLRGVLRARSGSDDLFMTILRDFAKTYRGKVASTDDFESVVEKHAGGEWTWFFDQWVRTAAIPTYRWKYSKGKVNADGTYPLTLEVEQSNVPGDFTMPVPVLVEFADGRTARLTMSVAQPSTKFELNLPAAVKKVTFNPDYAVLAEVKEM